MGSVNEILILCKMKFDLELGGGNGGGGVSGGVDLQTCVMLPLPPSMQLSN